jgi:hypothetical protein
VGVAWFPLAPREVFVPSYRTSREYVNNVNITNTRVNVTQVTNVYNTTVINNNTTNITRINYANQHVNNAVTAVSHDTFVNARPVAANITKVDPRQIENAPVVRNAGVQPVRASVMGTGRPVTIKPPATTLNRQVVATRQPTPPRASFEQRQTAPPNVRTETPGQPQTAVRAPNQGRQAGQPGLRPNETQRPQPPTMQANQPARQQAPPSAANPRPAGPPNVPRPGAAQPPEPVRPVERPMSQPPAGHPLVRPAPPVQENPQHQQNEQTKFNAWQQQRQSAAPRPPAPRAPQPPAHLEKPHK